ncbi:MAG: ATP-binding protein [Bdellovibrionota bacterium]
MNEVSEERLSEKAAELLAKPVISHIIERLDKELPKDLFYHSAEHTKNVFLEAVRYALFEGLTEKDIELLAIAAAYHDAGFIEKREENEVIGAAYAEENMRKHGYSANEIECVRTMIMDTHLIHTDAGLRQLPSSELSKYLLDADLSNFGRKEFFEKSELLRKETGVEKEEFLKQSLQLVLNHDWLTLAAKTLRQKKKQENIVELSKLVSRLEASERQISSLGLSLERLGFLAKLPLLLNSSLNLQQILSLAMQNLKRMLNAEAATVFLRTGEAKELTFWALDGGGEFGLEGKKMPMGKGIVGWVIDKREPVLVRNAKADPRFFASIDKETGFETKDLLAAPLIARGTEVFGAIQVLNSLKAEPFDTNDLLFVEQFCNQAALAIDNARLHEDLKLKNRKLETLSNRKDEVITLIGHEFRTPLNIIQTAADMLASESLKDTDSQQQMADTLLKGVTRLSKLVSQVKNVSSIDASRFSPRMACLDISYVVKQVFEQFDKSLTKRKLAFSYSFEREPVYVEADASLITIVIKNLISNAVRFTDDGGSIDVSISCSGGLAHIAVKDTGIGIAQDDIPLIFEKFYEVTDILQHSSGQFEFKSNGLGLGLATVRAILKEHGSEIEVKSKPGIGSTFSFSIELAN